MQSYAPIEAATTGMRAFPRPWWVAGGWAIDLFLDAVTRPHADIEIGIVRADQRLLHAYLRGWTLSKPALVGRTNAIVAWLAEDWLDFPAHQVFAEQAGAPPAAIDFFLDDIADGMWRYRPNPAIVRPATDLVMRSARGIPIIAPEIQLAYKARLLRPKDAHDFACTLPKLSVAQRRWLAQTIRTLNPACPWLADLA